MDAATDYHCDEHHDRLLAAATVAVLALLQYSNSSSGSCHRYRSQSGNSSRISAGPCSDFAKVRQSNSICRYSIGVGFRTILLQH